jgi:hypothetical protein
VLNAFSFLASAMGLPQICDGIVFRGLVHRNLTLI